MRFDTLYMFGLFLEPAGEGAWQGTIGTRRLHVLIESDRRVFIAIDRHHGFFVYRDRHDAERRFLSDLRSWLSQLVVSDPYTQGLASDPHLQKFVSEAKNAKNY